LTASWTSETRSSLNLRRTWCPSSNRLEKSRTHHSMPH